MTDELALTRDAARVYEEEFVPAIFAQWATRLTAAATLSPGDRVLDVGCGTGVLAREAAAALGDDASVAGVDINETMLDVARELAPGIRWHRADAATLPFADESFDAVVSQFVLMFVPDPIRVLREMWRVLAPEGRLVVSVWSDSPVYEAMANYCRSVGLDTIADSFEAFFKLADAQDLQRLAAAAGIGNPVVQKQPGSVRFASVDDFIRVEVSGWVLSDSIDEQAYELLKRRAEKEVAHYHDERAAIDFPMNAYVLSARKNG